MSLGPLLTPLTIPSPATGIWELGPVPLRGYALCIVLGVVLGIWVSERRWTARGGRAGEISDIAIWFQQTFPILMQIG